MGKPVEFGYKARLVDHDDGIVVDHTVEPGNPSMLSTGGGDAHRASDYDQWMRAAGLRPLALRAAPMHRVLLAVSPAL